MVPRVIDEGRTTSEEAGGGDASVSMGWAVDLVSSSWFTLFVLLCKLVRRALLKTARSLSLILFCSLASSSSMVSQPSTPGILTSIWRDRSLSLCLMCHFTDWPCVLLRQWACFSRVLNVPTKWGGEFKADSLRFGGVARPELG